jgi:AraC-like DNA-binding protein
MKNMAVRASRRSLRSDDKALPDDEIDPKRCLSGTAVEQMTATPAIAAPKKSSRHRRFRVRDFAERSGVTLDSPDDGLLPDDTLMEGDFIHQELREGLFLHVSDAMEERAFTASSSIPEGLSCIFFLDGEVGLKIGDRQFSFEGRGRSTIEGTAIVSARAESFERRSHGKQRLRHLVVTASPEWLDVDGLREQAGAGDLHGLFRKHLASRRWHLTPRAVDLVNQITHPPALTPGLRNLYIEGRAIDLVGETLAALMQSEPRLSPDEVLTHQDLVRLQRAREFIDANLTEDLSVDVIAKAAAINPSGLQQLFRLSEETSVFGYVRKLRLERAFEALQNGSMTIAAASLFAGYSNPANFATAFKKRFALSPRRAMTSRVKHNQF